MTVYSHSRLSTFENCALKYKLQYIDKIEVEEGAESVEAFLGSRFHEVMEKLYGDLNFKTMTLNDLISYFEKIWDENWSDDITIHKKGRKPNDYKAAGKKFIEDYYSQYHPFNSGKVLGIEKMITFDLDDSGHYKVRGYVDRIDQTDKTCYEIHDYKTGGSLPEQKYLDKDRQLALYQIALEKMWNDVKNVKLVWHYVAFNKEIVSTRTKPALEKLKKDTINLIKQIENTKEFPANETGLCDYCEFWDHCPKKKHLVKVSELPKNEYLKEKGVVLVNKYEELKGKKKDLDQKIELIDEEIEKISKAAINYAEKENIDAIYGKNHQLNVKIKQKVSFPAKSSEEREKIDDIVRQAGKWNELSTLDTHVLSKSILENELEKPLKDKISKYIDITTQKSITLAKIKNK